MFDGPGKWILIGAFVMVFAFAFGPSMTTCQSRQAEQQRVEEQQQVEAAATQTDYRGDEELFEATGLHAKLPQAIGRASYSSIDVNGNYLAQETFSTDALDCNFRVMKTGAYSDITLIEAGDKAIPSSAALEGAEKQEVNGVTWDVAVANDHGTALYYDEASKIMYGFSVQGPDLTTKRMLKLVSVLNLSQD